MKKEELLKYVDDDLLEKLFGFCYARTNDSYEAEELCSDVLFAVLKAANTDGEIDAVYPFFWKVARNVYADFSERRKKRSEILYAGEAEERIRSLTERSPITLVSPLRSRAARPSKTRRWGSTVMARPPCAR